MITYSVQASDGVDLGLHRLDPIPTGSRSPVLLAHGAFASHRVWLRGGSARRGLAHLLQTRGHDVWLNDGPEDEPALVLSGWMNWNLEGRWVGADGYDAVGGPTLNHAGLVLDPRADEECWPLVAEWIAPHAFVARASVRVAP